MIATSSRTSRAIIVQAAFTAAIFMSAFLLFSVQPMFSRMVLPMFGGSPAVWAVGVCFFQVVLLFGYAYAHGLEGVARARSGPRLAVTVHIGLLTLAIATLPLGLPASLAEGSSDHAYVWLLASFALGVGLPFFALSANSPLLQAWFARLSHEQSADPYFLYAASNAGSMSALICYPLVFEPLMPLGMQSKVWAVSFGLLTVMIAGCGFFMLARGSAFSNTSAPSHDRLLLSQSGGLQKLSVKERAFWAFLAFVPSGLLVSFTTYVTTDLASAPLLWVIPLALYLATFMIAFRSRKLRSRTLLKRVQPVAAAVTLWASQSDANFAWAIGAVAGLIAFFLATLECHIQLYERRPPPRRLTDYYLWMSAGGALGGLFASLVAPQIFTGVIEFPLFLGLGILVCSLSASENPDRKHLARQIFITTAAAAAFCLGINQMARSGFIPWNPDIKIWIVASLVLAQALILWWPLLAQSAAVVLISSVVILQPGASPLYAARTFFGTHKVMQPAGMRYHLLLHGMTLHGVEYMKKTGERPVPLSYYHQSGPLAFGLHLARLANGGADKPLRIGVVGLGTGAMACHAVEGDSWRFFEIDPAVVKIAGTPDLFTYLRDCQPNADIVLGDARLKLAHEARGSFDFLMIDAFSSDAIPVHLMTLEALRLYASLLTENGVLALHLSNQNLDLPPVIESNLAALGTLSGVFVDGQGGNGANPSEVVLASKRPENVRAALSMPKSRLLGDPQVHPWTDDYSNIVSALMRRYSQRIHKAVSSQETPQ